MMERQTRLRLVSVLALFIISPLYGGIFFTTDVMQVA
jgi:hypothetical protein